MHSNNVTHVRYKQTHEPVILRHMRSCPYASGFGLTGVHTRFTHIDRCKQKHEPVLLRHMGSCLYASGVRLSGVTHALHV